MKTFILLQIIVVISLIMPQAYAQQDAMTTQYMYNTLAVNPGYAGSRDVLSATAYSRIQWLGIDGSPNTNIVSVHTPFLNPSTGVGVSLVYDNIGPIIFSSLFLDYSYKIQIDKQGYLALGLKAGANVLQNTISELIITDPNDVAFETPATSKVLPNVGFGMYYYTPLWYAGVSTPKLIENNYFDNSIHKASKEQRHYYLVGGYTYKISNSLTWEPSLQGRLTGAAPLETDFTSMFVLREKFYSGLTFKTSQSVGLVLGMNVVENVLLSYSFDWSYGLKKYDYLAGSHEIVLRYEHISSKLKSGDVPKLMR